MTAGVSLYGHSEINELIH